MNTYTWSISQLNCIPQVGDLTDYCVVSHWSCTGTDGTFSGQVYSTVSFTVNAQKSNYIPYADLTEAEVIQWTQDALGAEQVAAIYTGIDTQIENQVNPPLVTPPLPWSKTAGKAPDTVDPKPVAP